MLTFSLGKGFDPCGVGRFAMCVCKGDRLLMSTGTLKSTHRVCFKMSICSREMP